MSLYFENHRPKTMFDAEIKVEFSPHVGENRYSLEFWIPRRGFRISRHCISVVSRIQDFLKLYSGFQSPGFRISQAIFFPDSRFHELKNFQIPFHGVIES